MSAEGSSKPRSLLDRFKTSNPPPAAAEPATPPPVQALVPAPPAPAVAAPAPGRPKTKALSFTRLQRLVSRETGGFETVIKTAVAILEDPDVEPRDRMKAAEFLAKWSDPNPSMTKREVTVSGPGGLAIPVAHAHAHVMVGSGRPDLSKFTDAELEAYERLMAKAAGKVAGELPAPAAGAVIDVEAE